MHNCLIFKFANFIANIYSSVFRYKGGYRSDGEAIETLDKAGGDLFTMEAFDRV